MNVTRVSVSLGLLTFLAWTSPATCLADDPASFDAIGKEYGSNIRPLLKEFCLNCHSTETQDGELDLEQFATLEHVRKSPRIWQKVVEMLDNGEMPPKKKPQPTDPQRKAIREWVKGYLGAEALANAGDPGAVILRRLNNVEYDNTVRDLTSVDLKPAKEFPVDGAAGEGFTNVGEALAISPAMLDKYVASAKGIAAHAVLLPEGFRFSDSTTRRDWTEEILTQIRQLYRTHTDPEGSSRVNLQGLVWDTNSGGRIPLEHYLNALIRYRDLPEANRPTLAAFASENKLSPKYLQILWDVLHGQEPSPLVGAIRDHWKTLKPDGVAALSAEIRGWQTSLTKFNSVAHFKPWMEPISPLVEAQDVRVKLAPVAGSQDVILQLVTREAGDGSTGDVVEWRDPRIETPGRAPIFLRDLRGGLRALDTKRKTLSDAARYLAAVDDSRSLPSPVNVEAIAKERQLDPYMLDAWFRYLGIGGRGPLQIDGLFTNKMLNGGGFDFVKSWGSPDTPSLAANSSDREVRIPGTLKAHGVAVHPSPTKNVAAGWLSPITGYAKITPHVLHAHPACGNGVSYSLELRRGGERRRLASGDLNVGQPAKIVPVERLRIQEGDFLSLVIGPRGTDHSCDLTEIDLTIEELDGAKRTWNLSGDISPDVLAGNPHADRLGNRAVWHFYEELIKPDANARFATIPAGSLLDRWRDEPKREVRDALAMDLQKFLSGATSITKDTPDAVLAAQLLALNGPLLGKVEFGKLAADETAPGAGEADVTFGLPHASFGKRPSGGEADGKSLFTQSSSTLEIRLPAELVAGSEFVASASLDPREGAGGSVQVQALLGAKPAIGGGLIPGVPILVRNGGEPRARFEKSLAEFRRVFPAALCYAQIVPVDEVVTLVLFHREDEALSRLVLNDEQAKELDRLWDELRYVSQDAIKVKEAYGQFMEYVTQDGDVRLFEPLRKPITERSEALKKRLTDTEPKHLDALVAFASRAYRRPLEGQEGADLRALYATLRKQDLDHEAAFRLTLARVLVAPSFLYHVEPGTEGATPQPVSDWVLASRLSYFLWSSMPDAELMLVAANGTLHTPEVLEAQTRRMLKDDRVRALATEFACQWIEVRGFDTHDEKSEQVFPEFAAIKGAMYEETVRFFVDMFQNDGKVLDVLNADYTFLNEPLAKFYGIDGVKGPEWRRVDGIKAKNRGGILGMATLLAKQSGASRTSPILRGNWLLESLLGEKLPKPPKNVPQLPESELDTNGLTLRQITEKHREIASCAKCHDKIDPYGFALEGFDAIGRRRTADLAGRPVDTKAQMKDGSEFADIAGLREYLLTKRRDEFLSHFCRKFLGYSLARGVQLSDEPLVSEMQTQLAKDGDHVSSAIMTIVRSPQFRLRRGLDSPLDKEPSLP